MYLLRKEKIPIVLLKLASELHQTEGSPGSQSIVQIELSTMIPLYHNCAPISVNQFGAGLILVSGT